MKKQISLFIILISTMFMQNAMAPHKHHWYSPHRLVTMIKRLGSAMGIGLLQAPAAPSEAENSIDEHYCEEVTHIGKIDWEHDRDIIKHISEELLPFMQSISDMEHGTISPTHRDYLIKQIHDYARAKETSTDVPFTCSYRYLLDTLRIIHGITQHSFIQRFQFDTHHRLCGPIVLIPAQDIPQHCITIVERTPQLEHMLQVLIHWIAHTPEMAGEMGSDCAERHS